MGIFTFFYRAWKDLPERLRPYLIVAMHNKHRLRTINQCTEIIWKRASHQAVGGVTTAQIWLGFTMPTLLMPHSHLKPQYCTHVIRDLLEFAPANVPCSEVNLSMIPDTFNHKFGKPIPFQAIPNTFCSNGILPLFKTFGSSLVQVVCHSPFTPSRICVQKITTIELARFLDLPVAYEKRLQQALGNLPTVDSPLLTAIPLKLLQHTLYLSGVIIIPSQDDHDLRDGAAWSGGEILWVPQLVFRTTMYLAEVGIRKLVKMSMRMS